MTAPAEEDSDEAHAALLQFAAAKAPCLYHAFTMVLAWFKRVTIVLLWVSYGLSMALLRFYHDSTSI